MLKEILKALLEFSFKAAALQLLNSTPPILCVERGDPSAPGTIIYRLTFLRDDPLHPQQPCNSSTPLHPSCEWKRGDPGEPSVVIYRLTFLRDVPLHMSVSHF
ncbi:hypothetical protein CEXT_140021 [Caerostris extrusa]|uniref:Uncharacterized protein n=1 Tax=Caerostris extrusa TaxID=172846 RepID=A0AAV4QB89_CAEEX|nr:hypothetical protein CEXT_140021 [Caerostris extrusa]